MILDKPTAALNTQAEYERSCYFRTLVQVHTSILMIHHVSTVRMADPIAALADGRTAEPGLHEELLSHRGFSARLCSRQAEPYR